MTSNTFLNQYYSAIPPKITTPYVIAKLDSGASGSYFRSQEESGLQNIFSTQQGPTVTLPNDANMKPTKRAVLPFPGLSKQAAETFIYPDLQSASLISVGKLCDDGCHVTFYDDRVDAIKHNKLVLQGYRNRKDGLWDVPIPTASNHAETSSIINYANVIIPADKSIKELINYFGACLFSPPKSTFLQAAKNNNFVAWRALTPTNISKYYDESIYTTKGHLNQEQKNLQSTKMKPTLLQLQEDFLQHNDSFPNDEKLIRPSNDVMCLLMPFQAKNLGYFDLTGRFPYTSSRGNQYIMVMYHYDHNAILVEATKSRQAAELKKTFLTMYERLQRCGAAPNIYICDNECAAELKYAMKINKLTYQLAPPHQHRRNAAERAIQTFKNHFIAGLTSVDPDFPISEWDRLLPQAELSLNLLRNSRLNNKLSSYAAMSGFFNFAATPLAPPGTKTLVHEKPEQRASWDPHAVEGWYVGPALEHYRCVKVYLPQTFSERVCDTVKFFPHKIPFPTTSPVQQLTEATNEMIRVLQNPSTTIPGIDNKNDITLAVQETAKLLNRAVPTPTQITPASQSTPSKTPNPFVVPPPRVRKQRKEQPAKPPSNPPFVQPPPLQRHVHQAPPPRVGARPTFHPPSYTMGTPFRNMAFLYLARNKLVTPYCQHIYNKKTGKRETIDTLRAGEDKIIWDQAVSNELGRLAKSNDAGVEHTDTIEFIAKHDVPSSSKVTYGSYVFDYRPHKKEKNRARLVAGGDKLEYEFDASAPAASLLETKILVNSIISDAKDGARFMSLDLKDFFLASPMSRPEYMKLHYRHIPDDIRKRYNLDSLKADDGYIYVKIKKGMYGLKQAAILAFQQLKDLLEPHGYIPVPHTIGMWKHKTRRTVFCLCVDDFGIKYYSQEDADHLINALKQHYKITIDKEGRNYCGLTFDWDYDNGWVDISMPGYIDKVLHRYNHTPPPNPEYSPHIHTTPVFGQRVQYAAPPDDSPKLSKPQIKRIQGIIGSLLYYSRAIDSTMLTALNEIAAQQASATEKTLKAANKLLDYAATYHKVKVRFHASDMILYGESDAAYLVLPKA